MQDLSRLLDDVYGSGGPGGEVEPGETPDPPNPPPSAGVEDDVEDDVDDDDGLLGLRNPKDTPPGGQARILDLDADLDAVGRDDRTAALPVLDHDADDRSHTEAVPVLHLDDDDLPESEPTTAVAVAEDDDTHDGGDDTHRGWVREDDDILPRVRRSRWRLPRR